MFYRCSCCWYFLFFWFMMRSVLGGGVGMELESQQHVESMWRNFLSFRGVHRVAKRYHSWFFLGCGGGMYYCCCSQHRNNAVFELNLWCHCASLRDFCPLGCTRHSANANSSHKCTNSYTHFRMAFWLMDFGGGLDGSGAVAPQALQRRRFWFRDWWVGGDGFHMYIQRFIQLAPRPNVNETGVSSERWMIWGR